VYEKLSFKIQLYLHKYQIIGKKWKKGKKMWNVDCS